MENVFIDYKHTDIRIEDGIIFNFYKPNIVINLEIAKQIVAARHQVSDGIARPVFVDISNLVSIDLEAREYLAGEEAIKLVIAGALYSTNPISKFAGKLYLDVNKPQRPFQIFTNKKEAIEWLQQFK